MKCALIIFLITFNVSAKSIKDKTYGILTVSEVVSIYDGDTFTVNIKGVHPLIGKRISIRAYGIDTPELRGKCQQEKLLARRAKQLTVQFLRAATVIELRNVKRDKYFRIDAEVYGDGKSLNEILLKSGLAVKYNGNTKVKDWCAVK